MNIERSYHMPQQPRRLRPEHMPPPRPPKKGWRRTLFSKKGMLIVLFLVVGLGWYSRNHLVSQALRISIPRVQSFAAANGLPNIQLYFESAKLTLPDTIVMSGIVASAPLEIEGVLSQDRPLSITARQFKFGLFGLLVKDTRVEFNDMRLTPAGTSSNLQAEGRNSFQLFLQQLILELPTHSASDGALGSSALHTVKSLLTTGSSPSYLALRGVLHFRVGDNMHQAQVISEKTNGAFKLKLAEDDVLTILKAIDKEVNHAEAKIVADYPLRSIELLRIKDSANSDSNAAAASDPSIPLDAYRHILWSFRLTKKYGAEFAEKVTDAHEANMKQNSPDTLMDFNNNKIGRQYAQDGLPESSLLELSIKDDDVIRSVDEL